jgi:Tat protein translocase TatB subunit
MPNVGITELLVVLAIALLVIGPKRIPELGRSFGRMIREFRRASSSVQEELGLDEVRDDVAEIKQSAQKVTGSMNVRSHLGLDELEPIKMEVVDAAAAAQAAGTLDRSAPATPSDGADADERPTSAEDAVAEGVADEASPSGEGVPAESAAGSDLSSPEDAPAAGDAPSAATGVKQ